MKGCVYLWLFCFSLILRMKISYYFFVSHPASLQFMDHLARDSMSNGWPWVYLREIYINAHSGGNSPTYILTLPHLFAVCSG